MLKPWLITTAACSGLADVTPMFMLAAQHDPRHLVVTTAPAQASNFVVRLAYRLTGGPDSVITAVKQGSTTLQTHRLPPVLRDSFLLARPAPGITVTGQGCVTAKRRGLLSNEVCSGYSYTEPTVDTPPPDPILDTVRADTIVAQPPPSGGAVFYQNDFSTGLNGLRVWNTWPVGYAAPGIVNGALQVTWGPSGDNNNRGAVLSFAPKQTVHVRFRLRLPTAANIGGIQKLIRFRGPGDEGVGTLNIQWNQWNWGWDAFGGANNFATGSTPNDCKAADCWVEAGWQGTPPNTIRFRLWINGTLRIDVARSDLTYSDGIEYVYLWSYFNTPADARIDRLDDLVMSTSYIGVP